MSGYGPNSWNPLTVSPLCCVKQRKASSYSSCDYCRENITVQPSCAIGDVETVFEQGDALIARLGFIEQCNSSGAVQKSHFHSLFSCGMWRPVHPLLCVKNKNKKIFKRSRSMSNAICNTHMIFLSEYNTWMTLTFRVTWNHKSTCISSHI